MASDAGLSDDEEYHSAAENDDTSTDQSSRTSGSSTVEHHSTITESSQSETTPGAQDTHTEPSPKDKNSRDSKVEVEYVSGLDNRYVSEDHNSVEGGQVELTEEQIKEMKEQANKLKSKGNESFKGSEYEQAVEYYSDALKLYPPSCEHEVAVCYANRAACHMKMESHQNVIDDCTKALELEPHYLKAILRRAQACEAIEKYEDALEDYKRALEIDPSQSVARQAILYLPDKIKEQQEKLKEEMIGKLKELGNVFLKPFGLSTDNFQLQQDPQSGGYSVNFKR